MKKTFYLALLLCLACSGRQEAVYPNDGTLEARQIEAAGKKPRVIVMTDAEATDNGWPSLTSYARFVITVEP